MELYVLQPTMLKVKIPTNARTSMVVSLAGLDQFHQLALNLVPLIPKQSRDGRKR